MKQRDLDRLRKRVGPEFSHLLGEVDEEEGLGIDGGDGEDDGFHKMMRAICNPQPTTRLVPTFTQDLEMTEFMKGGLNEVGMQMSQGTSFPVPRPQPGPSKPGPSSPTGRPTGQPYPTQVPAKRRFLSLVDRLKKNAHFPGLWQMTVANARGTYLEEFFNAANRGDEDKMVAAMRSW